MSTSQPDSYATQLENKLLNHGCTPAGAAWVMKALHPVVGGAVKMPDANAVNALNPQYTTTVTIGPPTSIGTSNWDAIVISPPSDCIAAYYSTNASGSSGFDFSTSVASDNSVLTHATMGASASSNFIPAASCAISTGVWTNGISNYVSTATTELPASYRLVAKSVTGYAAGSALYNQGTVYSAQFAAKPLFCPIGQGLAPTGVVNPVVNIDDICLPLKESDMATMTPSYYTTGAVEGFYSVHRLNGPIQDFVAPRSVSQFRLDGGSYMGFSLANPVSVNASTGVIPRILTDAYTSVSPVIPPSSGMTCASTAHYPGMTWGVTIFRGLHPQMTISLKVVSVLELVPTANAPSRQFITPPPEYDPVAIRLYYHLAHELRPVMASRHNLFGTLLPMISSVLSKAVPILGPLVGQGLSALGGLVTNRSAPAPTAQAQPPSIMAPRRRASSVASRTSRGSHRSVRIAGVKKNKLKRRK